MNVDQIDTSKYTHIHFAFANVSSSFDIDISGAQDQFDRFKAMAGDIKKVISLVDGISVLSRVLSVFFVKPPKSQTELPLRVTL